MPLDDQQHLTRIHWCCEHVTKYAAKLNKKDFGHGNANFDALCWHLSVLGSAAVQVREPVMREPIKTERLVVDWETLMRLPAILMPDEAEPNRFEDPELFEEFVNDAIPLVLKAVKERLAAPAPKKVVEEE